MSKAPYKIPFIKYPDGTFAMMEYTSAAQDAVAPVWGSPTEWRDNVIFAATLKLAGQYRGRSAARVKVTNTENGEHYSMALGAFYEAVCTYGSNLPGFIYGKWTFRKQGQNYTVYPVAT